MKLIHEFVNAVSRVYGFATGLNVSDHLIIAADSAGGKLNWRLFEKVNRQFVFGEFMKIKTDSFL